VTYDVQKKTMGKEFVVIVELHIDTCSQVYGTAPCTAAVPTTGAQKCFNTLKTCQDLTNYTLTTRVYRFATTYVQGIQAAGDSPTFPTVRSVDTAPTKLSPGKGLGIRSSVVVQLDDHPWTDVGVDPYFRDRAYVADNQGSFWGKFLARNPNYEGRRIDILTGYFADDGSYVASNFKRRTYLLNKISGPDTDGRVSIEAKDPLRKTDLDKAQWPTASRASLSAVALIGDTVLQVGDPDGQLLANFNLATSQPYARIDDEIVKLTAIVDDGGGFYTLTVSRSDSPANYDNSLNVQSEHSLAAVVQACWFFDAERIDHVLYTLLADGASILPAYLPVATWNLEVLDGGLDNYLLTALIVEPTGVQLLLDELSQHGIFMWWDERQQLVLLKSIITQAFGDAALTEDTDIIAGSLSVTRDVKNRISQAWMYFGLRFPTLDMKLLPSYSSLTIKIDTDAESTREYDQSRAQIVFSRWLPTAKAATASEISTRLLRAYRDSKVLLALSLDAKDDAQWTGDLVGVLTSLVQDESGAPLAKNYIVLEVDEVIADSGVSYRYLLQSDSTLLRGGTITPTCDNDILVFDADPVVFNGEQIAVPAENVIEWGGGDDLLWDSSVPIVWAGTGCITFPDYGTSTATQKSRYAFICYDTGFFLDGTPAYQIR